MHKSIMKKLETTLEIQQWLNEVHTAFNTTLHQCKYAVGTGNYAEGTKGYALEVQNSEGVAIAVTPIGKYLFDKFRAEGTSMFEA
ncbi:hypothetical protein ACN08P_23365 (plasmid) [Photobacterium leiognathi subsp. mandapamensis]|uniref:hypothetical protein n=1 Tax=Photobacterium leiognathi TaxID=553611 RepID=UPI003AF3CCE0